MRSSRILEASLRAQGLPATSSPTYTMQLLLQATHTALQATSPEGAFSSVELLQNRRLAVRACSQHISALKAACQPLPLQVDAAKVLLHQIQVVSVVANLGPIVYSWAIGEWGSQGFCEACMRASQGGIVVVDPPFEMGQPTTRLHGNAWLGCIVSCLQQQLPHVVPCGATPTCRLAFNGCPAPGGPTHHAARRFHDGTPCLWPPGHVQQHTGGPGNAWLVSWLVGLLVGFQSCGGLNMLNAARG